MDQLSFAELRATNVRRCETAFHPVKSWSPMDWAGAMAGEAGEVLGAVKTGRRMARRWEAIPADVRDRLRVRIADEIADVIIYADLLAARLGIDLGAAVRRKFNLVSRRRKSSVKL